MNPDKTRFADGSQAMMNKDGDCGCNCCMEPVVSQTFNQTASRFNERAAYANVNQMDNQTLLLSMFQAQAQNALEQTPSTDLVTLLAHIVALAQQSPA